MTEQKVKKRAWVKNAAIIFLSVLLALTLFSNTLATRYLPEVATQQVTSGTLSVQIRGTGAVTPAESFEVKSTGSRKVLSVPVKIGDRVSVGDTLILFSEAASDELKAAQDALDQMILNYQKALINATDSDYTKENRDIQLAQQALDKAKADRDANIISLDSLQAARANVERAKTEVAIQQAKVNSLQDQLSGMSPVTGGNSSAISAKQNEIRSAETALSALELVYGESYEKLKDYAKEWIGVKGLTANDSNIAIYMDALATDFKNKTGGTPAPVTIDLPYTPSTLGAPTLLEAKDMVTAYTTINTQKATISSLRSQLADLQGAQTGDWNYDNVKNQLNDARSALTTAQNMLTGYEATLTEIETKYARYTEAEAAVASSQRTLEDLMFSLTEKKKADGKMQASEALDLAAQQKAIEDKRTELESLQSGGEGSGVTSQVNGIVAVINTSAGQTASPDMTLMVVEVPDMGYTLSFPVSTEQSQRVRIGDAATVLYNYWGSNKTANLAAIKTNPENPTTSKLLVFKLGGDIVSGEQLSISIGEKGSNYDAIVPNSAIRTDSNGDFVLVVEAKSSVLGNRFTAVRMDVKILAKDDVSTAVSGGLATSYYVITHSSKPIEPGMRVRLPD